MRICWSLVPLLALMLSACGMLPVAPVPIDQSMRSSTAIPGPVAPGIMPPLAPPILQTYVDPQGRYMLRFPPRWTAMNHDGFGEVRSPDGLISVSTIALPGDDIAAAAAAAWRRIDPTFTLAPVATSAQPARGGVDAALALDYDDIAGLMIRAFGQCYSDHVYLILQRGVVEAVTARQDQLALIEAGLTIKAIPTTNLVGVAPQHFDADRLAQLDSAIVEMRASFDVPGASVAIVQNGAIIFNKGYGVRVQGGQAPLTADTLLQVGSTGKTLTTLLLARMVDQGVITWDTPTTNVLPQFAVANSAQTGLITVRHLVCKCIGVPRNDDVLQFQGSAFDAQALIRSIATLTPTLSLDEHYQYSNQMVATGGFAAAAAVYGPDGDLRANYTRLMAEEIFTPLEMPRTTFDRATVQMDGNYALPHAADLGPRQRPLALTDEAVLESIAPAGGGLWSSANEMAYYLQPLLRSGVTPAGVRIVSTGALGALWTPQVPMDAAQSYGLGWRIGGYKGIRLLSHPGNTLGFTSDFALLPEAGLGVVVLSNQANSLFPRAVREHIFELAFDLPADAGPKLAKRYAAEQAQAREDAAQLAFLADPQQVAPFLGSYWNTDLGLVELRWERGALLLDIGEAHTQLRPLPAEGVGMYVAVDAPLVGALFMLTQREDGSSAIVYKGEAGTYRFERTPRQELSK